MFLHGPQRTALLYRRNPQDLSRDLGCRLADGVACNMVDAEVTRVMATGTTFDSHIALRSEREEFQVDGFSEVDFQALHSGRSP